MLEMDVGDPPVKLRFGDQTFTVPFWKLFYDLSAIDVAHKGDSTAMFEAYRQYIVQISGLDDGLIGIGDATAFHRKYWTDFEAKKTLADGQASPSPQPNSSTPTLPGFTESPCPPCQQG